MRKICRVYLLVSVMSVILFNGCTRADVQEETRSSSAKETENTGYSEQEGSSAQIVFEGHDMEGNVVSSSVLSESELTMVNVWATFCSPCLSEMPELGELAEEYDPEEFQIIGIISDVTEDEEKEKREVAEVLIEQTRAGYTHLPVNDSINSALLADVTAVPTTFFIDKNGTILDTVVGAMDKASWKEKIDALLEEQ